MLTYVPPIRNLAIGRGLFVSAARLILCPSAFCQRRGTLHFVGSCADSNAGL